MSIKPSILNIDFDGTVVDHRYPDVGPDLRDSVRVIQRLVATGHRITLFTMRSGKELSDAVDWFRKNNISLYGVNANPDQHTWTSSPKPYAHRTIDDSALGCPMYHEAWMYRPGVDWQECEQILEAEGFLEKGGK